MPGICPNCVKLVQEGDTCPDCRGPLISAKQWNAKKEQFLQPRGPVTTGRVEVPSPPPEQTAPPPVQADYKPPAPQAAIPAAPPSYPYPQRERIPFYALRFLLGAMTSVAVFVAILVAVNW